MLNLHNGVEKLGTGLHKDNTFSFLKAGDIANFASKPQSTSKFRKLCSGESDSAKSQ